MALRLTDCHRVSEIPRSVFADLARRFERGEIVVANCDLQCACRDCRCDAFSNADRLPLQEELAIIFALRSLS